LAKAVEVARSGSKRVRPVGSYHPTREAWEVTEVASAAGLLEGGVRRVEEASRHPGNKDSIRFVSGECAGNRYNGAGWVIECRHG